MGLASVDGKTKLLIRTPVLNEIFSHCRICPGQVLANRSLFINVALLLWAFRMTEDPETPIDTLGFTDTANTHPLPFKVVFEAREGAERLIAADSEA